MGIIQGTMHVPRDLNVRSQIGLQGQTKVETKVEEAAKSMSRLCTCGPHVAPM